MLLAGHLWVTTSIRPSLCSLLWFQKHRLAPYIYHTFLSYRLTYIYTQQPQNSWSLQLFKTNPDPLTNTVSIEEVNRCITEIFDNFLDMPQVSSWRIYQASTKHDACSSTHLTLLCLSCKTLNDVVSHVCRKNLEEDLKTEAWSSRTRKPSFNTRKS
jgi:hypothetical protein